MFHLCVATRRGAIFRRASERTGRRLSEFDIVCAVRRRGSSGVDRLVARSAAAREWLADCLTRECTRTRYRKVREWCPRRPDWGGRRRARWLGCACLKEDEGVAGSGHSSCDLIRHPGIGIRWSRRRCDGWPHDEATDPRWARSIGPTRSRARFRLGRARRGPAEGGRVGLSRWFGEERCCRAGRGSIERQVGANACSV